MIKQKPCKPNGKTSGYKSCGNLTDVERLKYGICPKCYVNWLMNTEPGKVYMQKAMLKGKVSVKKEINKQDAKTKIELMSTDKYRSQKLQPIINEIARLIDFGQPCIATGNYGKMNGGHYISVAANRTTALNIHNIHIQSFESNHFKSGDPIKYRHGLIAIYGNDYFEFVEYIQQQKPLHLTKLDMIEISSKASIIRNELKKQQQERTPIERIKLRNEINLKLGVYDECFSVFNI